MICISYRKVINISSLDSLLGQIRYARPSSWPQIEYEYYSTLVDECVFDNTTFLIPFVEILPSHFSDIESQYLLMK